MKKLLVLFLACLFLFVMIGCQNETSDLEPTPTQKAQGTDSPDLSPNADPLKVAIIMPGSINDGGFNAAGYNAAKNLQDQFGCEFSYSESVAAADAVEQLRNYAIAGYELIIGHSSAYGDAMVEVAADYPDVFFLERGMDVFNDTNLVSVKLANVETGFMQGATAALATKTNKVGCIVLELDSTLNAMKGFEAGAKFINPDIEVYTVTIANNSDTTGAKEAAIAMYQKGADIIMQNCDPAGQGVYEAAREENGYVIASVTDQSESAPDVILACGVESYTSGVAWLYNMIATGQIEFKCYNLGASMDTIDIVFNAPVSSAVMSSEAMTKFDEVRTKLIEGSLDAYQIASDILGETIVP